MSIVRFFNVLTWVNSIVYTGNEEGNEIAELYVSTRNRRMLEAELARAGFDPHPDNQDEWRALIRRDTYAIFRLVRA